MSLQPFQAKRSVGELRNGQICRSSRRDTRLTILHQQAIRCRNVRLERRPRRLSETRILYRNQATLTTSETLLRFREQQTVRHTRQLSRDHQDSDTRALGTAGAMTPFAKRAASSDELSLSTPFEKRSPLAVAHPYELNEISHLLATRGRADGTIEYF